MKNSNSMTGLLCGCALCALLLACSGSFKGKDPFWRNGYVYGSQAYSLFIQGKMEAAALWYGKGLAEAMRLDIPEQTALYGFNVGRCWFELGSYDSALAYFIGSHREFTEGNNAPAAARTAGFIALTYCSLCKPDSAVAWYDRMAAADIGEDQRALRLSVQGRLLISRGRVKESLRYFDDAFVEYKRRKAFNAMAQMCRLRAGVYYSCAEYHEAKKRIDEALSLCEKSGLRYDRFRVLLAASAIYARLNDIPACRRFFDRARACAPASVPIPAFNVFLEGGKEILLPASFIMIFM